MVWPVVTKASGGIPVVDVTAVAPLRGLPVTEAANGFGVAVTKVAVYGWPVVYVAPPLLRTAQSDENGDENKNVARRGGADGRVDRSGTR
jgi:hypothetical protein